jgi:hypothetical protein
MKVVINRCFGGFGLSHEAMMLYSEFAKLNLKTVEKDSSIVGYHYYLDGIEDDEHYFWDNDIKRNDVDLVKVVETLGSAANGWAAELKVVEIPDGIEWYVDDYDGLEVVNEKHRSWS